MRKRDFVVSSVIAVIGIGCSLFFFFGEAERTQVSSSSRAGAELEGPRGEQSEAERRRRLREQTVTGEPGSGESVAVDARSADLFGRVSTTDDRPISSAEVLLVPEDALTKLYSEVGQRVRSSGDARPDELLAAKRARVIDRSRRAKTNAEGEYRFTDLPSAYYHALVRAPAYIAESDRVIGISAGEERREDFVLVAGATVSGVVVDARSGQPLAGASVVAEPSESAAARGVAKTMWTTERLRTGDPILQEKRQLTARDGTFAFHGLEHIRHHLTARAEGYSVGTVLDVEPGARDVRIAVGCGGKIVGEIRWHGKARRGVGVYAVPEEDIPAFSTLAFLDSLAETGEDRERREPPHVSRATPSADGGFELAGIPEGWHCVGVFGAGVQPLLSDPVEMRGDSVVDAGTLHVYPDQPIQGRVFDVQGRPLSGAAVRAVRAGKGQDLWGQRSVPAASVAETQSEPDGKYRLSGLPAAAYDIEVWSERYAPALRRQVETGTNDVDFRLTEGFELQGVVVNGIDGTPVANAEISTFPAQRAKSDEDGRFTIEGLTRPADLRSEGTFLVFITVRADGFSTHREALRFDPEAPSSSVRLELPPSILLEGEVVRVDGAPVAGAEVRVAVPGAAAPVSGAPARVVTAEDGRFSMTVDRLRAGGAPRPPVLIARHPEHGLGVSDPIDADALSERAGEFEIILSGASAIRGQIVDASGEPVAGARVTLRYEPILSRRSMKAMAAGTFQPVQVVRSREGGRYGLEPVLPGDYRLEVNHGRYAPAFYEVSVEYGSVRELDVTLESGGFIAGDVLDSSREPLADVEVLAARIDRFALSAKQDLDLIYGMTGGLRRTRSDENGGFQLENLPRDPITVIARAPGFEIAYVEDVTPESGPIELILTREARIEIAVRDASTGRPVTDYQVSFWLERSLSASPGDPQGQPGFHGWGVGGKGHKFVRDAEGEVFFGSVPAGQFVLGVEAPGYDFYEKRVIVRPGEESHFDVPLHPGVAVEGRVVREGDGEGGIEEARVQLLRLTKVDGELRVSDAWPDWTATTDADGRFLVPAVPRGTYRVEVSRPDGMRWVKPSVDVEEDTVLEEAVIGGETNGSGAASDAAPGGEPDAAEEPARETSGEASS